MSKRILLTGGAGFIGSHTYVSLVEGGYEAVILDDFSNSSPGVLDRLRVITGRAVPCIRGSIQDRALVCRVLRDENISAVVQFAAFKAVGESVAQPLRYYDNNVGGMIGLLQSMNDAGCRNLIFSSSATVYGEPESVPIAESARRSINSPYGHTKLIIEDMLGALHQSDPRWAIGTLRYFNPVGAHPSGLIGEHPRDIPNNLMPYVTQVALGQREYLSIFGADYDTPDGTGVRDYIHIQDLANGHLFALNAILEKAASFVVNLGTGVGYSVLDLVRNFEAANDVAVPYRIVARRPGDIASCFADPRLANTLLGWQAKLGLRDMCTDAWRWQQHNPRGYDAT